MLIVQKLFCNTWSNTQALSGDKRCEFPPKVRSRESERHCETEPEGDTDCQGNQRHHSGQVPGELGDGPFSAMAPFMNTEPPSVKSSVRNAAETQRDPINPPKA